MSRHVLAWILWVFSLFLTPVGAVDAVDATFAPVIRGPGSVRKVVYHPASALFYAAVSGDKLNGHLITSNFLRFSADGTWDAGYSPDIDGTVVEIAVQADGKILIAGSFTTVAGHPTAKVARLMADGTVDPSFVTSGGSLPASIRELAVAGDGTIYVGAAATSQSKYVSGNYVIVWPKLLYKLDANGVLDTTFAPEFSMADVAETNRPSYFMSLDALLITPEGSVIVGGNFTKVNTTAQKCLAKFSPAGVLAADYQPALSYVPNVPRDFNNPTLMVSTLADAGGGKHYVGGTFNRVNGSTHKAVARLDGAGVVDTTFQPLIDSPFVSSFNPLTLLRIAVDGTGRVVLSGTFEKVNGVTHRNVARVDANGLLDPSLGGSSGITGEDFALLPGDDLVFWRSGSSSSGGVLKPPVYKILADGTADPSLQFDLRRSRAPDFISPRPGKGPLLGSIWMMEVNGVETGSLVAMTQDGQVDTSFQPAFQPTGGVRTSLVLPDGRVLVGGFFSSAGGFTRPNLALLEADGSPVEDFNLGSGPDATVEVLRLMPSGKILAGGNFSKINGENAKGSTLIDLTALSATRGLIVEEILEASYGTASAFSNVGSIVSAALVGGAVDLAVNTTTMGGDPAPGSTKFLTVRFRTNRGERTAKIANAATLRLPNVAWDSGLLDRQFRPANTETLFLKDAAGQPDGKILLLGSFSAFAGNAIPNLVRLWPDGSVDSGFQPASKFSFFSPEVVRVSPSGQIYIGDLSLKLSGSSTSRGVYRLTSSGSNDSSFTCPSSIDWVYDIALQPDGSVWCSGIFGSTATGERKNVARLLPNGSVDSRFDAGISTSSFTFKLALESPGKLWLVGSFTKAQELPREGLALIHLNSGIAPLAWVVPKALTVTDGTPATFGLTQTGSGETYAWQRNGVPIIGATGPSLTLTSGVPVTTQTYTAKVTNSAGTTTSSGTLTVREAALSEWLASHGLNGLQAAWDSDGDGHSNAAEYLARTLPDDGTSVFSTRLDFHIGSVRLSWDTYPGRRYSIERSDNLHTWIPVGAAIAGDGGEKIVDVPYGSDDRSLYWRVRLSKP